MELIQSLIYADEFIIIIVYYTVQNVWKNTGLQLKSCSNRIQSKLYSGIIEVHDLEIFLITTYVRVIIPTGILNYKQAHSLGITTCMHNALNE